MRVIPVGLCILALTAAATAVAQSKQAPAYLITEFEVIDAAGMQKFGDATMPLVKIHGGQFLARRGKVVPVVGDPPKNVAILAFASVEKVQAYLRRNTRHLSQTATNRRSGIATS
jgi:uncharacterized protein (DUF1330 family)